MSTCCSIVRCNEEKDTIVGTSTSSAHRDVIEQDLGHFDNLLWNRQKRVEETHDFRQLYHHLRDRNIQNLYRRSVSGSLLHGAQLILVLCLPRLTQTGWPGTLGGRRFRNVAVQCNSCLLPGPCRPSGAVRYGAWTRQGPWRRSSAHDARRRRRSLRRRALPVPPPASSRSAMASQPLRFDTKSNANLFEP